MVGDQQARRDRSGRRTHDLRTILWGLYRAACARFAGGGVGGRARHGKQNSRKVSVRILPRLQIWNAKISSCRQFPRRECSEIEVVNLNGQRWTIPFDGPSGASQQSARSTVPAKGSREFSKPMAGFNTWVLSPPVRPAETADGTTTQPEAPPAAVLDKPSVPDSGPASPLVANSTCAAVRSYPSQW